MKKYIIFLLLLSVMPAVVCGQAIKTDFDKKVIMVDSLNLPPNTSVSSILNLLPELLQRPGDFLISNYDVQVEGMSVGQSSDVAISQLQIVDIEKVEVSESPVSSYNNNGQGGSINIVLRSSGYDGKSSWGSMSVAVAYPNDIAPQFTVGYKTSRFKVRGIMLGEVYNLTSDVNTLTLENDELRSQSVATTTNRHRNHLARAYMEYRPSDRDVLKFNVSEMYSYQSKRLHTDYSPLQTSVSHAHSSAMQSMLNYQHVFGKSKFTAEMQYVYTPGLSEYDEESHSKSNDYYSHQYSGKLELNSTLINRMAQHGMDARKLALTFGVNLNGVVKSEDLRLDDRRNTNYSMEISPDNSTYYAMPYARIEGTFGRFRTKLVGEFQHFKYNILRNKEQFSKISNDLTGKFVTEYYFSPTRNLRFTLDRKLQRPNDKQLYPYRMYDPQSLDYVEGNPELTPMMSHEVSLDYIANFSWDDQQSLVVNAGGSLNHVSDIITSYTEGGTSADGGVLGMTQQYLAYKNSGRSNILGANFMALYTYKAFTMSLTSNLFHNRTTKDGKDNHYTYYNVSLYPHFNLKDGWHGGAHLTYYSTINMKNATKGNAAVAFMTIGRAFSKFFVFAYQQVALQRHSSDETITADGISSIKQYDMTASSAGIGVKFTF